jgi:hypothetical protein
MKMGDARPAPPEASVDREPRERMVLGLLAAPGVTHDLAEQLAEQLPGLLRARFPDVEWETVVAVEALAGSPAGIGTDLAKLARQRMLREGWQLAIVLTDLPLRVGRRLVTAQASVTLGVGVLSVPALGAVALEDRVGNAVLRLVERLMAQRMARRDRHQHAARRRPGTRLWMHARLEELASPMGHAHMPDDGTVLFVTAPVPGNLRLLLGMVRANRPWQLIAGLSRALVTALGTAAFALTSPGIWLLMNGMHWPRLLALSIGSVLAICVTLVVVHELWERSPGPGSRRRVLLINLATVLTITVGMVTHYLALFVICTVAAAALIPPSVFQMQIRHEIGAADYLKLAWLVTSLATIGGALGAAVENESAVREAAYGYRSD